MDLADEIEALGPGETLKAVTRRHMAAARLVAVDDPAVLEDLDTPGDVERVRGRMG
jgi:CTP:molybdopterin cytidylyltransferase MocA